MCIRGDVRGGEQQQREVGSGKWEVGKGTRVEVRSEVAMKTENENKNQTYIQPTITRRGMTKVLIWIELPTAMPIVSSIFPFKAIHTAVKCSAALATIGRRMSPMNASGM
jgi:uncharacterized membrane protein